MLLHRVLSALVGIPLLVWLLLLGGVPWLLSVGIVSAIGMGEMFNIVEKTDRNPLRILGWISVLLIMIQNVLAPEQPGLVIAIIISFHLLLMVFGYNKIHLADIGISIFAILYVGWFMSHLYLLRIIPNGFSWVLFVFLANWATDTAAYFVGRAFGKHKLAPSVSPNKTIEGSLGGIVGGILVAIIFPQVAPNMPENATYPLLFLGILISILGQLGDLVESAMKRKANIKDSGKIIPGHGGILDRFDSILLTVPLAYYFIKFWIN